MSGKSHALEVIKVWCLSSVELFAPLSSPHGTGESFPSLSTLCTVQTTQGEEKTEVGRGNERDESFPLPSDAVF